MCSRRGKYSCSSFHEFLDEFTQEAGLAFGVQQCGDLLLCEWDRNQWMRGTVIEDLKRQNDGLNRDWFGDFVYKVYKRARPPEL